MIKLKKYDYIYLGLLILFCLLLIIVLTGLKYIYGSTTDWQNQGWTFPEYFRNLFYTNHDLMPSFSLNIGAGQNIYNFSYYGLLNPVIVFSYLLPFVKMIDYLVITSIIEVIVAVILFYRWLKNNGYSSGICFFNTFIFLCSGPLIFHSHRQLMFINYVPFLILALIGIDIFFKKKKLFLLLISTFLMIMTSYYFSFGGIIILLIYGIYKYFKTESKPTLKSFFSAMLHLAVPIMIAVLMSSVLLLPTVSAILSGRNGIHGGKSLFNLYLFSPQNFLQNILYSPYCPGLTSIAVISVIGSFLSKKKENIILCSIISVFFAFPVFTYALNGTLYVNPKVLIPFLPLLCMIIANYTENLFTKQINKKDITAILLILTAIETINFSWHYNIIFFADATITIGAIMLYKKMSKKKIVFIPVVVICALICFTVNMQDELLTSHDENIYFSDNITSLIKEVQNTDRSFYRFANLMYPLSTVNKIYSPDYYQTTLYSSVYNRNYNNFYYNIFNNEINFRNSVITNSTSNVLFNILIGNKYLITDHDAPIGYDLFQTDGDISVYKNDNVFPLGYATDNLMSENDFDKLNYPCTDEALLNYCIVNNHSDNKFTTDIKTFSTEFTSVDYDNVKIKENGGIYSISAEDNANITLKLGKPIEDKVLFIRFKMRQLSRKNDTYITINNVKNKLTSINWKYQNNNFTFDYVLSSNKSIDTLNVEFKKGFYQISDFQEYTLDYDKVKNIRNTIDAFQVDMNKTCGNNIYGSINVSKDGYFILNIPYDRGFKIKVNGESVNYEKVNKAFIGFKVNKGEKNISISYQAPMQKQGILLSISGIILSAGLFLYDKKKKAL